VESHGDAVAVLPYDAERRCALVVRLFRAPVLVTTGEVLSEEGVRRHDRTRGRLCDCLPRSR
jgi:hypothetical protein